MEQQSTHPTLSISQDPIFYYSISSTESADPFFAYLHRPEWFKILFKRAFDQHRHEIQGVIYLARSSEEIVGSIYFEATPKHASYGKQVPIFGWL